MANPFDQLDGYEMAGFFSKLKKAVKKVGHPLEKAVKKVRDKALPSRVAKELSRAAKNPIIKAAALGALAFVAAPMVGGALSKLGIKTAIGTTQVSGQSIALNAGKSAAKAVVKKEATKALVKRMAPAEKNKQLSLASNVVPINAANNAASLINQASNDPAFVKTIQTMVAQGKTPDQIVTAWKASDSYQAVAQTTAATAVYDQVLKQVIASGVPAKDAPGIAKDVADQIGKDAAKESSGKIDWLKVAAIGAPVALAVFGG